MGGTIDFLLLGEGEAVLLLDASEPVRPVLLLVDCKREVGLFCGEGRGGDTMDFLRCCSDGGGATTDFLRCCKEEGGGGVETTDFRRCCKVGGGGEAGATTDFLL